MQESVLYIVLILLCVVIYLLLNQKKSKNEDNNNKELGILKETLTNSINAMSTSFNSLSKDVTRDMTQALTKVDEKVGTFNQQVEFISKSQNNFSRILKEKGQMTEGDKTITGITNADPGVVTASSHGFLDGEFVVLSSVVGMTEVNGVTYKVANKTTNTFELNDVDGNAVDTSTSGPYSTYTSGGVANRIYQITKFNPDTFGRLVSEILGHASRATLYLISKFQPAATTHSEISYAVFCLQQIIGLVSYLKIGRAHV